MFSDPSGRALPACCLTAILVILCGQSAFAADKSDGAKSAPPNILFVLTDDQRYDALGCMGNRIIRTPHVDRLAAEGVIFDNAFVTTSICAISRASFMLGQWERRHNISDFRTPFSEEQLANTFPLLLRKAGYRTGLIGKWGVGRKLPEDAYDYFRGFAGQNRYFPPGKQGVPGEHLTHKLGAQALEFLDGCSTERPFLLQLYTKSPHCQDGDPWPFQPDPRYNDLYTDVTIPLPKTATEAHFKRLPKFLQSPETSEARARWIIRFENEPLRQKSVKDYYRLITGVDDVVGDLLAKLREKGLDDNTVVIFTSDNGFYLGEHGLAGKWFMHEESIRIPLVIHDPRLPADLRGRRLEELALNVDIAPTVLELAGIAAPAGMQGASLLPLMHGHVPDPADPATPLWRDEFFYEHRLEHPRIPMTEGVRTVRWKYTRYTSVDPVYEELFDLDSDPHEEQNLVGSPRHERILRDMRTRTDHWAQHLE